MRVPTGVPALSADPLLPPWAAIPLAGLVMLLALRHVLVLQRSTLPRARRTLRKLTALTMILLSATLGYAVGLAAPARPRVYVASWSLAGVFAVLMGGLAALDAWLTARAGVRESLALRRERRDRA